MKRFTFLITLFTLFSTLNAQDLHWAFNIGNTAPDEADVVSEIATDAAGNVYATGYFRSTADFDPDPAATHNLVSHGLTDIYVAKYTSAGALVWAFSIGSGWFDSGAGIDLDSEGNVYVTGSFGGANVDFDPAPGSSHLLSVNGGEDIFVAKYDNDGNFLWAHHTGSTGGNEGGADILVDGVDNVLVTGTFRNANVDFDPGIGTFPLSSNGNSDIFVAKYSRGGSLLWAIGMGGEWVDGSSTLGVDAANNVYLIGSFSSLSADFDPHPTNTFILNSQGNEDAFLAKYSNAGVFEWAFSIGTISIELGTGMAVDPSGNAYITGEFRSANTDFDPSPATANLLSSNGNGDIFLAKYNSSGAHQWAFNIGGTEWDQGSDVALDGAGHVYITGSFRDVNVDFDPDPVTEHLYNSTAILDIFLAKYTTDGVYAGGFHVGGTESESGRCLAADASGTVYLGGNFYSLNVDFDPGAGTHLLSTYGNTDFYLAKYGPTAFVLPPICPLPGGYIAEDIGDVSGNEGLTCRDASGIYTSTVAGTGIKGAADGFHFVHRPEAGDLDLIVRVTGIQNNASRQAGLMLREGLGPDAANVAIVVNGQRQVKMTRRSATGGVTMAVATDVARRRLNSWLRLTRTGPNVIGYYSSNGTVWEYVGTASFVPAGSYEAGIAVSKGATGGTQVFTLDNFSADGVALRTAFEGPEWKVQPYPNPVKDQLSYQITAPQGSQVLLRLLDLTGRVVRSERLTLDSPFWEGELNTFDLQTGVYILEVQTETQRQTVKLVKE